jgi:hypothetical protein
MSEETKSAASHPEVLRDNEAAPAGFAPPRQPPMAKWFKRLLACNPFYLSSAALLLYGLYRVSVDPGFLPTEVGQLVFNFTSLQIYELLLVVTAIVLARRCIWYDSALLLILENLLLFVPFILINQAGLIEQWTVWALCLLAALLAVGRWGAAYGGVSVFRLSPRLLAGGAVVLGVNAAWVIAYRIAQETKAGMGIESGAAYEINQVNWLWLLPALCALANLLPRPRDHGELLVQRRWFPVSLFLVWIAGTGAHLYALGYIYDWPLRRELLAPGLWALAWTLHLRLGDFIAMPGRALQRATLALPLAVALMPMEAGGGKVFFALNALNVVAFAVVIWRQRGNRFALHLALVSLAATVASLPVEVVQPVVGQFDRLKFIGLAALAYLVVGAALSRNPKVAVAGAFGAALAAGWVRGETNDAVHWSVQSGLTFFLLHGLRWRDYEHQGAAAVRVLMAGTWVLHSFVWVRCGAGWLPPLVIATIVLALCGFRWWLRLNWSPVAVPVAGLLVALGSPANLVFAKLQTAPAGVVAVVGSFLLFGLGTLAELTKSRWSRNGWH